MTRHSKSAYRSYCKDYLGEWMRINGLNTLTQNADGLGLDPFIPSRYE